MVVGRDTHRGWHEDMVEWDGTVIPYRYCHARRRTLGMTVRPDRSVSVRVPLRTPLAAIREFVARRGAWIIKVWARFDGNSPAPVQSFEKGAPLLYQGAQLSLALEPGPAVSVQLRDDRLVVVTPEEPSPVHLSHLIDSWYRARAAEFFRERLIACLGRMQLGETPLPPLLIRPMTSRWGSYSYRTRRITLNLNLIKLPVACLDYVIVHELCHITVRHHGPAFWALVGYHVPEYASLRRQLNTFIPLLQ